MRYKGTTKTLAEIARELRVDALLEGSVVREQGRIGITAQLIQASTDRTLWAERFERELRSVLTLQGEIARSVARQVAVTLTPEEEKRLARAREVDPAAYEAYLKGSFHIAKLTPEGIKTGLAYLHEAVEKDPGNALAHAGLALGYSLAGSHSPSPPKDAFEKARASYTKALELDDTLAEGHAALAEAKLYRDWDWEGASTAFRRAIELNPSLARAHVHYGWYLNLIGRQAEAVDEMQRGRQLDPLDPTWAAWYADLNSYVGRYEDAAVAAREAVELGPSHHWSYEALALAESGRGRHEEAIAAGRKAAELNPGWQGALALVYARAGMKDEALAMIPELEKTKHRMDAYLLPPVSAAVGDRDKAVRWTQTAIEMRNPFAPWLFAWNDVVGPLRDDPRYQALRARLHLPPPA
jgi:tetratricopeptide (TPR) repeat protein